MLMGLKDCSGQGGDCLLDKRYIQECHYKDHQLAGKEEFELLFWFQKKGPNRCQRQWMPRGLLLSQLRESRKQESTLPRPQRLACGQSA